MALLLLGPGGGGVSLLWMQYIHMKGIHAWDQVD